MSCWNDFDILREVVVGRAEYKPLHLHDEPATRKKLDAAGLRSGDGGQGGDERTSNGHAAAKEEKCAWRKVLQEKNKELMIYDPAARLEKAKAQVDSFVTILKDEGVNVLRPDIVPGWEQPATSPFWSTNWQYGTPCPRDLFIKFGDLLVETYSGWRCRYFEGESYYQILEDHCERTDSRFVKMPRGVLSDQLYPGYCVSNGHPAPEHKPGSTFTEHCGIIEAADIRRFGKDVFMQTGGYSNQRGFDWLKRMLKKESINLHKMTFEAGTSYYHLDAKFSAIEEGTILYSPDPAHRPSQEIFDWFKERDWNLLEAPWRSVLVSPEDFCSSGLNLNFLPIAPKKIIVEKGEKETVKFLQEECGADCIEHEFSSTFEFGGAFNCWTLDLIRG